MSLLDLLKPTRRATGPARASVRVAKDGPEPHARARPWIGSRLRIAGGAVAVAALGLGLLASAPSCGLDRTGTGGNGGAVGQGLAGGGGAGPACTTPEQCPGTDTACWRRTCSQGFCSPELVVAGTPCQENGGNVCDGNGTCVECLEKSHCPADEDCQYKQCVPSHCTNGQLDVDETDVDCGGAACVPCANDLHCNGPTDCWSGFCDTSGGTPGTCLACAGDDNCTGVPPTWCDPSDNGGTCVPRKPNGDACASGNQCLSGFCPGHDGVCCDTACDRDCEACLLAKSGSPNGTCGIVAAGEDPDVDCVDGPPCGPNGTGCTGTSAACVLYPPGAWCAAASCSGSTLTPARYCDGTGSCAAAQSQACANGYVCAADGLGCLTECGAHADCIASYYCNSAVDPAVCTPDHAEGQPCGSVEECPNGNCPPHDDVCCDMPCTALCRSCLNDHNGGLGDGHCGNVPDGQDPDDECPGSKHCQGDGTCS
jgi:hypothetical protein